MPPIALSAFDRNHAVSGDRQHAGQFDETMAAVGLISALSAGYGMNIEKVILPPEYAAELPDHADEIRKDLLGWREHCRRLFNALGKASLAAGLPAWGMGLNGR